MKGGDLAAVVIGLSLVILLTLLLPPQVHPSTQAPAVAARAQVTAVPSTPAQGTTRPSPSVPASPSVTAKRIFYTDDYDLFPIRFLPDDMTIYGFSDPEWQYNSSVAFAYVDESHGGITEPFTVPYPIWRVVSTLYARRTPETARFGMILVDEQTGRILDGTEISHPGSVTKTVVTYRKPVYMVIEADHLDSFYISLETPSVYIQ